MNVLSKNKKNIKKKSSENEHFYSRKILLNITWACFRNDMQRFLKVVKMIFFWMKILIFSYFCSIYPRICEYSPRGF